MAKIALVTGASSGLGKEYVLQLAKDPEIEEFWVIARRKENLDALASMVKQKVKPIALDLTNPQSIAVLSYALEDEKPDIRVLICAAGMGTAGGAMDLTLEQTDRMIELNIRALTDVTRICIPYMSSGSRILEIGSIAGFQPLPGFSVYAASKAFVQSYSKALHQELKPQGIWVTCVCPYWVSDTEFIGISQKDVKTTAYSTQLFPQKASDVVRRSLRDSKLHLWVSTPGIITTADRIVTKIVPHCIVVPVMGWFNK